MKKKLSFIVTILFAAVSSSTGAFANQQGNANTGYSGQPQMTSVQQVKNYVDNMRTLQNVTGNCKNQSRGRSLQGLSLNQLAKLRILTHISTDNFDARFLINWASQHELLKCIQNAFPDYDVNDIDTMPGDQTTYMDMDDVISPYSLQEVVVLLVRAAATADAKMHTPLAQLFTESSWNELVTNIQSTGLDTILGNPDTVMAGLSLMHQDAAQKNLADLIRYLITIQ